MHKKIFENIRNILESKNQIRLINQWHSWHLSSVLQKKFGYCNHYFLIIIIFFKDRMFSDIPLYEVSFTEDSIWLFFSNAWNILDNFTYIYSYYIFFHGIQYQLFKKINSKAFCILYVLCYLQSLHLAKLYILAYLESNIFIVLFVGLLQK